MVRRGPTLTEVSEMGLDPELLTLVSPPAWFSTMRGVRNSGPSRYRPVMLGLRVNAHAGAGSDRFSSSAIADPPMEMDAARIAATAGILTRYRGLRSVPVRRIGVTAAL